MNTEGSVGEPNAWRHVSLGGRVGSRQRLSSGLAEVVPAGEGDSVPMRIADFQPAPPERKKARSFQLDGVNIELPETSASGPRTLVPKDEEVAELEAVEEDVEEMVLDDDADQDPTLDSTVDVEVEPDTDEIPIERVRDATDDALELDSAAVRDDLELTRADSADEIEADAVLPQRFDSGFSVEDTPTSLLARGADLTRLTIVGADGVPFWFSVDAEATIGEAEVELLVERWLPRFNVAGQLLYAWRLAEPSGDLVPTEATVRDVVSKDGALELRRITTQMYFVTVVVRSKDANVEARHGVSGSLRVAELVATLRDTHALPARRWRLTVDGRQLFGESLLEDVLSDGLVLELSA